MRKCTIDRYKTSIEVMETLFPEVIDSLKVDLEQLEIQKAKVPKKLYKQIIKQLSNLSSLWKTALLTRYQLCLLDEKSTQNECFEYC